MAWQCGDTHIQQVAQTEPTFLNEAELTDLLSQEFTFKGIWKSKGYTETLLPRKTDNIRGEMANGSRYKGTWWRRGAKLCTRYRGVKETCKRVQIDGSILRLHKDDGEILEATVVNN